MRRKPKASNEHETLAERKARMERGSRGKSAETKVYDILSSWQKEDRYFDFDRLLDSRSAGKIVAAQVSDFLIFRVGRSATLEVKEIKKGMRLSKGSFPQHPRMVRRELTGCKGFLIVYTVDTDLWWAARVTGMEAGVPSWKLQEIAHKFADANGAMEFIASQM